MIEELPINSGDELAYGYLGDSKSASEVGLLPLASGVKTLHFLGLSLGQLVATISLSKYLSPLLDAILMIGERIPKKQVVGSNARRIVAAVQDVFPFRDSSKVQEPGKSVSHPGLPIGADPSIRVTRLAPSPAISSLRDACPEPIPGRRPSLVSALAAAKSVQSSDHLVTLGREEIVADGTPSFDDGRQVDLHEKDSQNQRLRSSEYYR